MCIRDRINIAQKEEHHHAVLDHAHAQMVELYLLLQLLLEHSLERFRLISQDQDLSLPKPTLGMTNVLLIKRGCHDEKHFRHHFFSTAGSNCLCW